LIRGALLNRARMHFCPLSPMAPMPGWQPWPARAFSAKVCAVLRFENATKQELFSLVFGPPLLASLTGEKLLRNEPAGFASPSGRRPVRPPHRRRERSELPRDKRISYATSRSKLRCQTLRTTELASVALTAPDRRGQCSKNQSRRGDQ